ncbi:hypothetical protein NG798_13870 [Ancylothrix sp. C2]|uniref:DUF6737 family protein n=1 Tax=Ancylothrix sp. D3o TaxID=2953691 RepID=UPI0021BA921A|nr:DUF6737 family protein [Ancylothrix sp. D3o]MCT7950882.1 hypothetical protein [Ancylothrix sp. D3o]
MSKQNPYNPWDYKPWWCQPWSIILTSAAIISISWLSFQRIWLTGIVAVPVLTWAGFFLLIWPKLQSNYYQQTSQNSTPPE